MCYLFVSKQINNIAHDFCVRALWYSSFYTHNLHTTTKFSQVCFCFKNQKNKTEKNKQKFPYGQSTRLNWIGSEWICFRYALIEIVLWKNGKINRDRNHCTSQSQIRIDSGI